MVRSTRVSLRATPGYASSHASRFGRRHAPAFARLLRRGGGRRRRLRQRRGDGGARQHDQPAQVDPDQEHRQRRQRAVDELVGRHLGEIEREAVLRRLERQCRRGGTGQCMRPRHLRRGDDRIQQGQRRGREQQWHRRQDQVGQESVQRHRRERLGDEPGRQRQARPDQDRPGGEPQRVDDDPAPEAAAAGDAPDQVDLALDGGGGHRRGHGDEHDRDAGEARGLFGEFADVVVNDGVRALRQHVPQQETLERVEPALEDGEVGDRRQRDRGERHEREERREREAGGGAREPDGVHPCGGAQGEPDERRHRPRQWHRIPRAHSRR